jgi:hypothetical protein
VNLRLSYLAHSIDCAVTEMAEDRVGEAGDRGPDVNVLSDCLEYQDDPTDKSYEVDQPEDVSEEEVGQPKKRKRTQKVEIRRGIEAYREVVDVKEEEPDRESSLLCCLSIIDRRVDSVC